MFDASAWRSAWPADLSALVELVPIAAWLAPSNKQAQMRNGTIMFALWRDPLVMLDPLILPVHRLGAKAQDAL